MERKERALETGNRAFLWLTLLALPLVMHRGYFDVTETKTVFFTVTAGTYLCFRGVLALQYGPDREKSTWSERFLFVLALIALLSSAGSGFFRDSFLGAQGRYQGAGTLILYALLFIAVRRSRWRETDVGVPLLAGFALTAALAVLNHLGRDPLALSAELTEFDRGRYISTLGNINFAGAYFTLLLPAVTVRLLLAEKGAERLCLAPLSALGLWAVMAARSESSLLGLWAALALLPVLLLRYPAALRRWPWLFPGIAALMQAYRLLCSSEGAYLSALTRMLLHPATSAAMAVLGAALLLALRKKEDAALRGFVKAYAGALAALLAVMALLLTMLNTLWRDLPLGVLESWLRFSPAWGTDRGLIWARCGEIYRDYDVLQKLLGGGCGILPRLDAGNRLFPDAVLDTAHCEYLQILLNWGLLGMIAWLGWLLTAAVRSYKTGGRLRVALLAGVLAYAVQAAVNIAQAPSICLFVLLVSLSAAKE